jgi:hypothetical protein
MHGLLHLSFSLLILLLIRRGEMKSVRRVLSLDQVEPKLTRSNLHRKRLHFHLHLIPVEVVAEDVVVGQKLVADAVLPLESNQKCQLADRSLWVPPQVIATVDEEGLHALEGSRVIMLPPASRPDSLQRA